MRHASIISGASGSHRWVCIMLIVSIPKRSSPQEERMRMSQWFVAIALGTTLVAPIVQADDVLADGRVTKFANTISVNPLGLAFGSFNANWEHKIGHSN